MSIDVLEELKNRLAGVKENEPLAKYTTFKIGGPARYFFVARRTEDVVAAVEAAEELKLKYFILGGGSNVLASDDGFDGLIIKIENLDFEIDGERVRAGAGVNLSYLVSQAAENKLSGGEGLVGVPGTLGGAIWGNAGAYGSVIGDLVESVEVIERGKIKKMFQTECLFSYRGSYFKSHPQTIILSGVLKFQPVKDERLRLKLDDYLRRRSAAQPIEYPSAGSVFKNLELREFDSAAVRKKLELNEDEWRELTKDGKLAAAYLIEFCDLKGRQIGGGRVSEKHANFIINNGAATAADVIELISFIKQQVRDTIGVELREEIRYVGF